MFPYIPSAPDPMDPSDALAAVDRFRAVHAAFRQHWDASLRQVADLATAYLAGQRMAGRAPDSEVIPGTSNPMVPGPPGMHPRDVLAAFNLAVETEVRRRLDAMTSPGSIG